MQLDESRVPVLVAAGQVTERDKSGHGSAPVQLMASACRAAQEDAGVSGLLASVGHIAATGLTVDADLVKTPLSRGYRNLPRSVANLLDISPRQYSYAATGGNTPQYLVNHFSEQISQGREETVLLTGGESLATMLSRFDRWYKWLLPKGDWRDNPGGKPLRLGNARAPGSAMEEKYGMHLPANVYPLFENALQKHYGRSLSQHLKAVGEMFSSFTEVAANNPYAWFRKTRSAAELIEVSAENRMVAFPYTKQLNSMIGVNQAAALILTSLAKAKSLGIPESKWVFLHGCADADDIWNVSERVDFHSSPAMRRSALAALRMARCRIEQIRHFDIYSCFPSAVQIACDEFGIAHDDARGLSLTGGLPYFGGPGNNYSMHAIAEMMQRLRENSGDYGMLNANGWFLTKHSLGIYSTAPLEKTWQRVPRSEYQHEILLQSGPPLVDSASGGASIETFTVLFNRQQLAHRAIIIGRTDSGDRFLANTPPDADMLRTLCDGNAIGRRGTVHRKSGLNTFTLEGH